MMILMGVLERKGEYNAKYFYFLFAILRKKWGSIGCACWSSSHFLPFFFRFVCQAYRYFHVI